MPSNIRGERRHDSSMKLTPWQECCELIRSFDRKRKLKRRIGPRKAAEGVLKGQSDEVEFIQKDGQTLYSGTIAQGFLFDYLADHTDDKKKAEEEEQERIKFCILDDDDDDDEGREENWQSNWSGRVALETDH